MITARKRLICLLMALLLSISLFPFSALAGLEGPYAAGEKDQIFNYVTLSGAGAAEMNDWIAGEYLGVQEALREEYGDELDQMAFEFLKTRLMVRAMHFNSWDYESPIAFYIPANTHGSKHELTLCGYEDVDPADIRLEGVRLTGTIERHVFGDVDSQGNDGRIYWYTLPVSVPMNDVTLGIYVGDELYATIPIVHVAGESPVALYTAMQVYDYEEGDEPGTIRSMTLRVSGFSLTDDPLQYTYQWWSNPEAENEEDQYASVDASTVTPEDEFGYRYVTFDFNGDTPSDGMIWGKLLFDNAYTAFFFGKENHLEEVDPEQGENCRYRFRTDYAYDDDPYFRLGGYLAEVPAPYYCIFKKPGGPGAAPEVMPELVVLGAGLPDGSVGSQSPFIRLYQNPGSYLDGEWRFSSNGQSWHEWYAAGDRQNQYEFQFAQSGEYGDYTISAQFRKEGLRTVTLRQRVNYNDGTAPAPAALGILDASTNAQVPQREDSAVVSVAEGAGYLFYAHAREGLELFYDFDGCGESHRGSLRWNGDTQRYEVLLDIGEIPREASAFSVWSSGESQGYTKDSASLRLPLLFREKGFLRPLYAPTVPYELKKDEEGTPFCAVAPSAGLTGMFEAAAGPGRTQQMTLTYLTAEGSEGKVIVPALDDGKGQFTAFTTLPVDAERLLSVRYELLEDGEAEESAEYDLSAYRVYARSNLLGIPAEYAGARVELDDGQTVRSCFVSADNYDSIPLGDLPSGGYRYAITGASGHITGGAVTVTRGEDIVLQDLPALGSVTVTTEGFVSYLSGREINPGAGVTIELQTPDGVNCRIPAVTGEKRTQIPLGSVGSVTVNWDPAASDEIRDCTAEDSSFTVAGDETVAFTYRPFTFRTISGSVWGVKTYKNGTSTGYVPNPTRIILTQEVNRGGRTETVTFTATPAYGYESSPRGKWSALCYDNIPVHIEFRSFTWDTLALDVTENGDVRLGQTTLTYGGEMIIRLEAQVQTPASVREDGSPYFGASDSVTGKVDSGFLSVSQVWIGSKGTLGSNSGQFETFVQNGQAYLKLHAGLVDASETIDICAGGTTSYGEDSYSVPFLSKNGSYNYVRVRPDENGDPVATLTATYSGRGGQFRATVVENDSEYVGFLAFPTGRNSCDFTWGRGELTLPYASRTAGSSGVILAFMVPESDAEDMAEMMRSNPGKLWGLLPTDGGWSTYFFNQEYGKRLLYRTVSAHANATVYLEDLQPAKPMLTGVLDPYSFTCHYELTDSPNTVRLVGTLSKRYPDQVDQDKIKSITLYTAEDREDNSPMNATAAFTSADLGGGRTLITAELPLSYSHIARFNLKLVYWHDSVTEDRGDTVLELTHERDKVQIFSLGNPGTVYITDQLDAQGLTAASAEAQGTWKLKLSLRAFLSAKEEENIITVYDNGTPIYTFDVGAGSKNYWGLGTTRKLQLRLTDNLQAGIHVVWANRTLDGETISTEPAVFTLVEGRENNSVHVSELHWTHWNHRIGWSEDTPDRMYFENLSDLAGENIWIWPGKKHQMYFTVKNATSDELDGVNLIYQALWAQSNTFWEQDPERYGYSRSISSSGYQHWNTVTRAVPCKLITDNKNGNWSIWGIDEFYMGYLQGFEFEFDYNPAIDEELRNMTEQELSALETEAFYRANDLGDVPDDLAAVSKIRGMSGEDITAAIADMSEASRAMSDLDLRITEDSTARMKLELAAPTSELSEYTVSLEKGGTMQLPDILLLMEKERAEGNQNPAEPGWDVTWAEFETLQGSTLLRIASFDGRTADGRPALLTHTTYYITKSVADALEGSGSLLAAEDPGKPDHWTKQLYDGTSTVYGASDLTDEAWKAFCKSRYLKTNPGDLEGAARFANSESLIPKKLDGAMKVLGVADTIITYAKGPSGADPNGLRELLRNVHDEKARRSLEMQIRDYETLRYDIYKQDCAMSTYSTASNFSPMGPIGKVVVFVGGLANGLISGWSKDYNRQVYNTTLHDIQLQIKYEAIKQERLKKSFMDAEQWLRDKMDSIYGKGNWSEYALAEERKLWVLREYPGGILRYEWRDKAPEFTVTQDPSGFVYEAVPENSVEGVTATLYYSEREEGPYAVWTDPFGEQPNPQDTSDTGSYMWMVPLGWWKVRYEKEGYRTSESIAMPVPPIHTTVNIGLLSEEAPKAAVSVGEGEIRILFSKYMQLESMIRLFGEESYDADFFDGSAFAVRFFDGEGFVLPGTVSFPDRTANTGYKGLDYGTEVIDADWFVRRAVFTPQDPAADLSGVTWRFAEGMVSYAGVPLDEESAELFLVRLDPGEGLLQSDVTATDETGRVPRLPAPCRDDYSFTGWFTSPEEGEQVTAENVFTADTTLYAHWLYSGSPDFSRFAVDEIRIPGAAGEIPRGSFAAEIRITNLSCAGGAVLMAAAYDGEGRLLSLVSLPLTTEIRGSDVLTADFDNPEGEIARLKAFVLSGSGTPFPLAETAEYPG